MVETTIYVPEEMLPWLDNEETVSTLERNAMMLYPYIKRQVISHGKAAQILGIRKNELIELYGTYGIPYYDCDESNLEAEVASYRELRNKESSSKRYEDSLSKMTPMIPSDELPKIKLDLAGMSRYAREKGISIRDLTEAAKTQFGVYTASENVDKR